MYLDDYIVKCCAASKEAAMGKWDEDLNVLNSGQMPVEEFNRKKVTEYGHILRIQTCMSMPQYPEDENLT